VHDTPFEKKEQHMQSEITLFLDVRHAEANGDFMSLESIVESQ
jgi:hypothetical protein